MTPLLCIQNKESRLIITVIIIIKVYLFLSIASQPVWTRWKRGKFLPSWNRKLAVQPVAPLLTKLSRRLIIIIIIIIITVIIIQLISILIYLRANLTAKRPITKLARVKEKKQNAQTKYKTRQFI
jgi:uncharacterized membrane protein